MKTQFFQIRRGSFPDRRELGKRSLESEHGISVKLKCKRKFRYQKFLINFDFINPFALCTLHFALCTFNFWCPREELNLNLSLRRAASYPLNDEGVRECQAYGLGLYNFKIFPHCSLAGSSSCSKSSSRYFDSILRRSIGFCLSKGIER